MAGEQLGGAVAATLELAPGEARTLRFAIAWDLPVTEFGGGRQWWKRYTRGWGRTGAGRSGPRPPLARGDPGLAIGDRGVAGAGRGGRAAPRLVPRGVVQRAVLRGGRRHVLGGTARWVARSRAEYGRFALLECLDYRFYDTVDVDFYASAAILELWPELERRGIRDLLATVPGGDPTPITVEASGVWPACGRTRGRSRTTSAARTRTRSCGRTAIATRTSTAGSTSRRSSPSRRGATSCISRITRSSQRRGRSSRRRSGSSRPATGTATACRTTRGCPTRPTTRGPCTVRAPTAGCSGWGRCGRPRSWRAPTRTPAATDWHAAYERGRTSFEARLWRDGYYAYDDGGAVSSDSVMADQLAGQWYADLAGLGDLVDPERIRQALCTVHARNVVDFGDGLLGAVNGMRPDRTVDTSSGPSGGGVGRDDLRARGADARAGAGTEAWETARQGAAKVTYERGLWFRTPEAYDREGNYRASLFLRPLAIWAIEEARRRVARRLTIRDYPGSREATNRRQFRSEITSATPSTTLIAVRRRSRSRTWSGRPPTAPRRPSCSPAGPGGRGAGRSRSRQGQPFAPDRAGPGREVVRDRRRHDQAPGAEPHVHEVEGREELAGPDSRIQRSR